jgi:hypothetical protein
MLRRTVVDFSQKLQTWDGFGVRYKVNAIIPWAVVQRSSKWVGGDPNPGTAIRVDDEGQYTVEQGYYFFKQVCRARQPGMAVTKALSNDSEVSLIAFASNGTRHPDAFVAINLGEEIKDLEIEVIGSASASFVAHRSSDDEHYVSLGTFDANGQVAYHAPPRSVITFYGK